MSCAPAYTLAQEGAHAILGARTTKEVEEAAEAIRSRGQQATPLTLDVRDVEAAEKMIAAHQPFDILVNNACTNKPAPFVDVKVEDFDFVMSLCARRLFRGADGRAPTDRGKRGDLS
jgi:NADP-dependent 3-hydroxy acid dehydrogenase YdfG